MWYSTVVLADINYSRYKCTVTQNAVRNCDHCYIKAQPPGCGHEVSSHQWELFHLGPKIRPLYYCLHCATVAHTELYVWWLSAGLRTYNKKRS